MMRPVIWWRHVTTWFKRDRLDDQLAEEIGTHIEVRRQALIEQGWPAPEAAAEARRQFGNVTVVREQSRDHWGSALLTALGQDVRFGVRMMTRAPVLSAIVVLIIALGAGINSAIFVFASSLLRAPDVPHADSLVWLDDGRPLLGPTYPDYVDYRDRTQAFSDLAIFAVTTVAIRSAEPATAKRSSVVLASGNYFATLQVEAAIGRVFGPEDDLPPIGTATAVVSDGFWTRRFNRDPAALGQTIELNFKPFTIVGVLPATFKGVRTPDGNPYVPDIWVPLWTLPHLEAGNTRLVERTTWWGLQAIGRLREGVTLAQARAQLAAVAAAMDREYTEKRHPRAPWIARVTDLDPRFVRTNEGTAMVVLMTAGMLVLLIACANVAGLLMARASARRREVAVRLSLGASRTRIIRQFLIEGALLALAGTVVGWLAAAWSLQAVLLTGSSEALTWSLAPNVWTIAFALLLTAAATIGTGLTPALQAGQVAMLPALTRSESPRVGRLRAILVGTEVAVSLVLVLVSALLLRSVVRASTIDPGMPTDRLLTVQVDARLHGYEGQHLDAALRAVRAELDGVPGAAGSASVNPAPFSGNRSGTTIRRADAADAPGVRLFLADVSASFFTTAGQRLVRGRWFDDRAAEEVVINQALASRLWPGADPLGARITSGDFDRRSHVVVGVVRDTPYGALRYQGQPFMFRPGGGETVLLRTSGPATEARRAVESAIARVDPRFKPTVEVVADGVASELSQRQGIVGVAASAGLLALLVALAGIGASAAQSVAERTQEIGIRMALGAERRRAVMFVIRKVLKPVVVGLVAGLGLGALAARVLGAMLYGVSPFDPLAFSGAVCVLVSAALCAAWLSARRAATIDPLLALRSE
jgi:predicted permease